MYRSAINWGISIIFQTNYKNGFFGAAIIEYIYTAHALHHQKKTQHEHMHILVHIFMYIHLFRFCFVEHLARTTFTPHVIGDLNGEICIITFLPMCLL